MPDLVALAVPGGPTFVDALRRVWDAGDAVFPVDLRLPDSERAKVMATIGPTAVIEPDGERRALDGGRPVEPGDALVVATSGTTGEPKGVVHTHDSVAASARATSEALAVDPDRDRWLACLPLAHVGGLAVVTRALLTGTPLEVHDGFDADRVADAARRGATLTSLVTRALVQVDNGSFRRIVIGGGAPPPDRPANVIATYGMTETGSGCVYERQPLTGVEIRIDEADEIWLRGPMLFRQYRDGTDPKSGDGWFPTGDLGLFDENGVFHVLGRRGDVIVTGGEKVWPARVEPLLATHPDIREAAVVGRPSPDWGHEVVAVIVPRAGAAPTIDAVRDLVRAQLPAWYAPRAIDLVDQLPRTANGKIRRDLLA